MKIKMGINKIKLLLAIGVAGVLMGCGAQTQERETLRLEAPNREMTAAVPEGMTEQEASVAAFRLELLELAFESASAMPLNPFIKNRSKAQESVAEALLELKQPELAEKYIESVENWRKGAGYADLAIHLVKNGETGKVQRYLDKAKVIADTTEDWRRDTIRVKIAHAHALMGQDALAGEFGTDVVDSEKGKLAGIRAESNGEASFDERLAAIDELLATGTFDVIKNALGAYAVLFDQVYADEPKRSMVETTIRSAWSKMPPLIRFDLLAQLADSAVKHGDSAKALELAGDMQSYLDDYEWRVDSRISLSSRLAALRHRGGDAATAQTIADSMLALYEEQGETIVNIYRARTLHPLAEAYRAMGETEKALRVYRMAVEAGVVNPNSVPRAEDLTATCKSMAMNAVEPDAELWTRLREIKEGLGAPW